MENTKMSMTEHMDKLRSAWAMAWSVAGFSVEPPPITDALDGAIIIDNGGVLYNVPYFEQGADLVVNGPESWRRVERQVSYGLPMPDAADIDAAIMSEKANFRRITYNGVTVQATSRRSSSRDDKKYERTVRRGDSERVVHYGDPNMPMRRNNDERREAFNSRHSCDEKADPFAPGFWACYDWNNTDEKSDSHHGGDVSMENENGQTLLTFGEAVKALGDGRVGGYLVRFGSAKNTDLQGEFFTAETDFGISAGAKTSILYQHGYDPVIKRRRIGSGQMRVDDVGVWLEGQLSLRDEYERAIYGMVEAGKVGWSSGTAGHLVEREPVGSGVYHIKSWPLGLDASITPTPAEPQTRAVPLKSWLERQTVAGVASADDDEQPVFKNVNLNKEKNNPMSEQDFVTRDELKEMLTEFKTLGAVVGQLTEKLANSPAAKAAGRIAPDSETDHKHIKSFGDFCVAVGRGNTKRLHTVYGSTKDMSEGTGTAGGYLVPDEFVNELIQLGDVISPVLQRVHRASISRPAGEYPALDMFAAPTAGSGQTAFAGGVKATATAEAGALTETNAGFEAVTWRLTKTGGLTDISNELMSDSAFSVESLMTELYRMAVVAQSERDILRGSGAGEPEGILNANAAIAVSVDTDNTFAYADALEMVSRLQAFGGTPVWIVHPSVWTEIGAFELSTGSGATYMANLNIQPGMPLLGYEVLVSQHLPIKAAATGNAGRVILADLSAYAWFQPREMRIDASEHVNFDNDQTTFRFVVRRDGKSRLNSAITGADPQGTYTMSPFVYLND